MSTHLVVLSSEFLQATLGAWLIGAVVSVG